MDQTGITASLKQWARRLKLEIHALYFASRDPRVPWHAKLCAAAVVAYALSPIDLIPDFVPVLGALDDLVIVPLGIALALRMIPPAVMIEARDRAAAMADKPTSRIAAAIIVLVWITLAALFAVWLGSLLD